MSDWENICRESMALIRSVGDFIAAEADKIEAQHIEVKGKNSLVTYVDNTAEEKLVNGLHDILPEAGFITEEHTTDVVDKKLTWIIDPLDGTTNFIHGIPCYSVSVALMQEQKVVLGIVYEINMQECFYAWEGSQAFLNERPIRVNAGTGLSNALLATGFPTYDFSRHDHYMTAMKKLMQQTRGLRRLGSAAVDLVYVACGRFDGFYEYSLNAWDVAAGALIVERAGGKVSDFSGSNNYIFGKEIIAAAPSVHGELRKVLSNSFNG